jgi:hypothetical protein
VVFGDTETVGPDKLPGIQLYDTAPVAVNVLDKPGQIDAGVALAVITGGVLIVIVVVAVAEQAPLVTVTVYVPLDGGTIEDVTALLLHK